MRDIIFVNWLTERRSPEIQQAWENQTQYFKGELQRITGDLANRFREPPTGLLELQTILADNDYDSELFDAILYQDPIANLLQKAPNFRIIAYTGLTNNWPQISEIIENVAVNCPRTYQIAGGPHVSFTAKKILFDQPGIDLLVMGEAEKVILPLVTAMLDKPAIDFSYEGSFPVIKAAERKRTEELGKNLNKSKNNLPVNELLQFRTAKLPLNHPLGSKFLFDPGLSLISEKMKNDPSFLGVAVRYGSDILQTEMPDPPDLKSIPIPNRSKLSRIYSVADIIVNRGCPNECSFCSRTHLFPFARVRPLEHVIAEIDQILAMSNYGFINFYDNINMNHQFFGNFLDELIKRPNMLPWGAELRADALREDEVEKLKRAGCRLVATGIESGSHEVLRKNFKIQYPEKVKRGIELLKKYDVNVQAYFMIGLPGDTEEFFQQTLDFADSLPLKSNQDVVNFFITTPYPGADISMNPSKYGIRILSEDYSRYDCHNILIETEDLSYRKIEEMKGLAEHWMISHGYKKGNIYKI